MSPSMETPDILDNTPQAAVKVQSAEDVKMANYRMKMWHVFLRKRRRNYSKLPKANLNAENSLHTLSDGSVDIDGITNFWYD